LDQKTWQVGKTRITQVRNKVVKLWQWYMKHQGKFPNWAACRIGLCTFLQGACVYSASVWGWLSKACLGEMSINAMYNLNLPSTSDFGESPLPLCLGKSSNFHYLEPRNELTTSSSPSQIMLEANEILVAHHKHKVGVQVETRKLLKLTVRTRGSKHR
jgi:hypothetical protein